MAAALLSSSSLQASMSMQGACRRSGTPWAAAVGRRRLPSGSLRRAAPISAHASGVSVGTGNSEQRSEAAPPLGRRSHWQTRPELLCCN